MDIFQSIKNAQRYFPIVFASSILILTTIIFFAFSSIYIYNTIGIIIIIFEVILSIFVLSNFCICLVIDPGSYPKATLEEIKTLSGAHIPLFCYLKVNNIQIQLKWCRTCYYYRPPRCLHCTICNKCIERFDHHCPWVNNCIGRGNYRYFIQFLISLTLDMMLIFGLCLWILIQQQFNVNILNNIILICIMCIIGILFFPIFGLTIFHMYLLIKGRTTYEQITGKFSKSANPYNNGFIKNSLLMFCTSKWPWMRFHNEEIKIPEPHILNVKYLNMVSSDSENDLKRISIITIPLGGSAFNTYTDTSNIQSLNDGSSVSNAFSSNEYKRSCSHNSTEDKFFDSNTLNISEKSINYI